MLTAQYLAFAGDCNCAGNANIRWRTNGNVLQHVGTGQVFCVWASYPDRTNPLAWQFRIWTTPYSGGSCLVSGMF